jgi:hypothetical protein
LAVVGGLVFSQLLTLYITPVVYTYMDTFQHWLKGLRGPKTDLEPATEEAEAVGAGAEGRRLAGD